MSEWTEGIDQEIEKTEEQNDMAVADFDQEKAKRRPFHYWTVGGTDYRLKLQTSMIEKVESKYKANIINLVSVDGVPPLSVMLTIIQAAMIPWHHGMTYSKIQKLYDTWVDQEGGSLMTFYTRVVMPTLAVSGFFTAQQATEMLKDMEEMESLL